jgi:hypothetical protein
MNACTRARRLRLDVELDLAGDRARGALETHLAACPGCASWAARERQLSAALASLRGVAPVHVDVTARVAARVGWLPGAGGASAPTTALGGSALVAAAASVGLLVGAWRVGQDLPAFVEAVRAAADALATTAGSLLQPLATMATKLAGRALAILARLAGTLEELQQLARGALALGTLVMAAGVAAVLARDALRPRWTGEEPRP